jgi:4-amino-4-deoxy-L-arabinose transferase-like glycosyltransferase
MKNNVFYLVLIVILAVFLRFWQLGNIPSSLNWDEVAWGYNAYSIGIDGKDEFGNFLPYKYIESYGDYKPPVYAYLTVLPVKIFGLNEFSIRFASAIFGSLTVLITYFLVKRIFYSSDKKEYYGLIAALFLAVSPWHINLSRAAFEANVATFFVVTGVWLFLAGIQERKWYLPLSAFMFALSFYTFNSPRIVVPLLVIALLAGTYKKLLAIKKEVIIAGIIGVVLLAPLVGFLLSPQAKLRYQEVNIFSDVSIITGINQEIQNDHNAFWSKILHNRRFIYALTYTKHYFDNLNPAFLFISGDENHKFSTKDVGEMYVIDALFLLVGVFFLFRKKEGYWWVIPVWFLVGLIPASTARETPHALRTEITLPMLQILCAYGLVTLISLLKTIEKRKQILTLSMISLFIFGNVLYYVHGYYFHYGRESAGEWNYGYKDSIMYVQNVENQYDEVRVTRSLGRPYAYYAFYMKTDPTYFRKTAEVTRDVFGFVEVKGFSKYRFADDINGLPNDRNAKKILYINIPEAVPQKAKILETFHYPDGYHRLTAYTL